ncbi:unnamed protein product [Ambrosiozyma monospora]|uniref:Unnamed protein product n=1 Tax=Ambrosiozyma monospora TaxID=43982 RepID=A0ACB5SQT0_AMBMO|nr:unnamed protein product [Ambrosiozyma monospora]
MSIRSSDFEPKVDDSDHPEKSLIQHYNLWRVFVDMTPELLAQLQEQQQKKQQQQHLSAQSSTLSFVHPSVQPSVPPPIQPSVETSTSTSVQPSHHLSVETSIQPYDQQLNTVDDDARRLFPHENAQSTSSTNADFPVTTGVQEEVTEQPSPSIFVPLPQAVDSPEAQIQLPSDYYSSVPKASTVRSLKRRQDQRKKLWEQSDFKDREKDYPGCTVTISDFSAKRYRFERRTIYTKEAYGKFTKIHDCDPEKTTKEVFLKKLKESKEGLIKALRSKPGWSKLRWVNVNGIEKSTFFSIMEEFELDPKATSYMFNASDNFNVDTYTNDQLFCELCVLHCFEDNTNNDHWAAILDPPHQESIVEKLHRLCPDVTTYLKEKSKLRIFEPDKIHQSFFADNDSEFSKKAKKFEESKLLNTLNYSIGVERAWLFKKETKEVISFFENTGEQVEEIVLFDFIRNLRFHGEIEIDDSVCFENILSAFASNLQALVRLYQGLLYKFKVDLNTNASTKRLQKLHLMTDELNALKVRVDRLAKMVNVIIDLSKLSPNSTPYMLELKETLEGDARTINEMIDSIKNLIQLTFNQVAANTNKYMSLLALVSMVFLPMSFVTSYFGMNYFNHLHNIGEFWVISLSLSIFTVCFVGFPSIKRALFDSYRRALKIYECLCLCVALFKKSMELLEEKTSHNESTTSATTTQSGVTEPRNQGSRTSVEQAMSSPLQAVRASISSNMRQRNSNNDVNSNSSQPKVNYALHTSGSPQTPIESPNDVTSPRNFTARQLNLNVGIQNLDGPSIQRSPEYQV